MEKRSMTSRPVNNEVDFCKVYDMGTKEKIEKILLANRISYCCHFEDRGILNRIFPCWGKAAERERRTNDNGTQKRLERL